MPQARECTSRLGHQGRNHQIGPLDLASYTACHSSQNNACPVPLQSTLPFMKQYCPDCYQVFTLPPPLDAAGMAASVWRNCGTACVTMRADAETGNPGTRTWFPWCCHAPLATQTNPVFSPYIQCSVTRQVMRRWIRDCLLYNSQIALAARPLTKWCLRFQITLYHYCSEFGIIIGCQGRAPISEFLSVLGRPDLGWLMAWHCMVPGQHQLRPGQDYARLWLVSKVYPVKVQLMWYGILEKSYTFRFLASWVQSECECVCVRMWVPLE